MRLLPYGDRGLLVEVGSTVEAVDLAAAVAADPSATTLLADVVPGARTVLLVAGDGVGADRLRALVPSGPVGRRSVPPGRELRLPVVYDGPDLADVARLTGLSVAEVVAAHTGTPWQVGFGGFAPGFAYLVGGDRRLRVPRRATPRTVVPAGAVALAGEFSGVYPRESPGGWQLIGRTDAVLWDLDRDPPALLGAGMTVRFEVAP